MLHPPRAYLYLDAVARAGSIRKAAEKLHVASTALNRMILELEDQAGTPLFERLPRGVRPTAAGEVLIHAVRRSLSDLRSAESQIEQLRGLVRGTVRLGCAESVATDFVPSAIVQYQTQHPGVQFQVQVVSGVTNHLLQLLEQDTVELVLVHDPAPGDDLRVISRLHQPLCAMLRPDHPLAKRRSLRLADCQAYTLEPSATILVDQKIGKRVETGVIATHLLGNKDASAFATGAVLSAKFISENPEVAKRFAAVWARSVKEAQADSSARGYLVAGMKVPPQLAATVPLPRMVLAQDLSPADLKDFQTFLDLGESFGVIKSKIDAKSMVKGF